MCRRSHVSRLSATGRIVLPVAVRRHLGVGPSDRLRYVIAPDGLRLERASPRDEDPLVAFLAWGGTIDDWDYADP